MFIQEHQSQVKVTWLVLPCLHNIYKFVATSLQPFVVAFLDLWCEQCCVEKSSSLNISSVKHQQDATLHRLPTIYRQAETHNLSNHIENHILESRTLPTTQPHVPMVKFLPPRKARPLRQVPSIYSTKSINTSESLGV